MVITSGSRSLTRRVRRSVTAFGELFTVILIFGCVSSNSRAFCVNQSLASVLYWKKSIVTVPASAAPHPARDAPNATATAAPARRRGQRDAGCCRPGSAADHRIVRKTGCIIDSFILMSTARASLPCPVFNGATPAFSFPVLACPPPIRNKMDRHFFQTERKYLYW